MDINIGLKHEAIVKLRDELDKAISSNPEGRDGRTEVVLYGQGGHPSHSVNTFTINNDDMERDEVPVDEIYVEIDQ